MEETGSHMRLGYLLFLLPVLGGISAVQETNFPRFAIPDHHGFAAVAAAHRYAIVVVGSATRAAQHSFPGDRRSGADLFARGPESG
jgi:hypothetical protein